MLRARNGPDAVVDGHSQIADGDGMRPPAVAPDMADREVLALTRRLYWRRYSQRVEAMGIDSEDALQVVYLGLLTRSRSASRWDPSRGGLSTWLFVAMGGILLNLVDHQRRMLRRSGSVGAGEDVALSVRAVEEEGADTDEQDAPNTESRWAVGVDVYRAPETPTGVVGRSGKGGNVVRNRERRADDRVGRVG